MDNKFVYEKPADEKLYEQMRRKSLEGEPVKRERKRYKWNKKKFIRNMSCLLMVTVGITLAGHNVADNMREAIQENALYGELYEEYMDEVYHPAQHHVDGTVSDFYLDYDVLGDYIDESEDKELAFALTQSAIEGENLSDDENQMDKILAETDLEYNSYEDYLKAHNYNGYEDKDKFIKDTKQRIMKEASENELDKMQEKEAETKETGGKSL